MRQRGTVLGALPTLPAVLSVLLAGVLLAGVLLAGCGGEPAKDEQAKVQPSTPPTSPPSTPGTPGTPGPGSGGTSGPAPQGPTGEILASYQRTGGIAGFRDQLIILRDGRVTRTTRTDRCDFRLNPRQLADLRADLARADFANLRIPARPPTVADGFTYVVNHLGRTVRTHDGAIPAQLQPAMGRLGMLAAQPCLR